MLKCKYDKEIYHIVRILKTCKKNYWEKLTK